MADYPIKEWFTQDPKKGQTQDFKLGGAGDKREKKFKYASI